VIGVSPDLWNYIRTCEYDCVPPCVVGNNQECDVVCVYKTNLVINWKKPKVIKIHIIFENM